MRLRKRWRIDVHALSWDHPGVWLPLDPPGKRYHWLRRNAVQRARQFTFFTRSYGSTDYVWRVVDRFEERAGVSDNAER